MTHQFKKNISNMSLAVLLSVKPAGLAVERVENRVYLFFEIEEQKILDGLLALNGA